MHIQKCLYNFLHTFFLCSCFTCRIALFDSNTQIPILLSSIVNLNRRESPKRLPTGVWALIFSWLLLRVLSVGCLILALFWQIYPLFFITVVSLIDYAAHSLSSMIVDVVTLGCVTICRRPPNKKWIFGYGKIETVL